jgi:hypothetical protein
MIIKVKVKTLAKESKLEKLKENYFKVSVKAPPQKGKANQEMIKLIAEYFKIKSEQVRIVSGRTSPFKVVELKFNSG